jgi:hypothetical protein
MKTRGGEGKKSPGRFPSGQWNRRGLRLQAQAGFAAGSSAPRRKSPADGFCTAKPPRRGYWGSPAARCSKRKKTAHRGGVRRRWWRRREPPTSALCSANPLILLMLRPAWRKKYTPLGVHTWGILTSTSSVSWLSWFDCALGIEPEFYGTQPSFRVQDRRWPILILRGLNSADLVDSGSRPPSRRIWWRPLS